MDNLSDCADLISHLLPEEVLHEGFSFASLQLFVENLRSRVKEVEASLYESIAETAKCGKPFEDRTYQRLQQLFRKHGKLNQIDRSVLTALDDFQTAAQAAEQGRERMAKAKAHEALQDSLQQIRRDAESGNLEAAAAALISLRADDHADPLRQSLRPTPSMNGEAHGRGSEGGDPADAHAGEQPSDIEAMEALVSQAVESTWDASFVFSEGGKYMELRSCEEGAAADIHDAWSAAVLLGLGDACLRRLSDGLMAAVIRPTVLGNGAAVGVSGNRVGVVGSGPHGGSAAEAACSACSGLGDVVRFLSSSFGSCGDLLLRLGEVLWPRISKGVVSRHLERLRPANAAELDAFRKAADAARSLEREAAEHGLCTRGEAPLHSFVDGVLSRFLESQLGALLARARDLVMEPLDGELFDVGTKLASPLGLHADGAEGPILPEGTFKVSSAGQGLPGLMEAAVRQALESGSAGAAELFCEAARDMAMLLATLPPSAHARQLQVPRIAAIHCNNCRHAASALAAMQLEHGPRLSALVGHKLSFMGSAVALKSAGRASLDAAAEALRGQLAEVLDGAKGFASLHLQKHALASRKSVDGVLHCLKQVGGAVADVLPLSLYLQFAGSLLQDSLSRVVQALLTRRSFRVEETEALPILLLPLVEDAPSHFYSCICRGCCADKGFSGFACLSVSEDLTDICIRSSFHT